MEAGRRNPVGSLPLKETSSCPGLPRFIPRSVPARLFV